jgi:hypothetical protein
MLGVLLLGARGILRSMPNRIQPSHRGGLYAYHVGTDRISITIAERETNNPAFELTHRTSDSSAHTIPYRTTDNFPVVGTDGLPISVTNTIPNANPDRHANVVTTDQHTN